MTIPRKPFLRKVRSIGYGFKKSAKRVDIYRRRGALNYLPVPRNAKLTELFVRNALAQSGCSESEIAEFLSERKKNA